MAFDCLAWLMASGGPVVRYRTAAELMDRVEEAELRRLEAEMLAGPLARAWLARLSFRTGLNQVHGAAADTYETVMGKLTQFGCRAGMRALDERTLPYREWLARELQQPARDVMAAFVRIDVGTFLVLAGYGREPAVADYLVRRLETLYDLARRAHYDLYVPNPGAFKGIPAPFRDRPLLRPELFQDGEWRLPLIHDLYALAHAPGRLEDEAQRRKIDTVVDYIMRPEYQGLTPGYGIIPAGPGHYYACGWSAHLPDYHGLDAGALQLDGLVQRVALLGRFPAARQHPWWRAARAHLEGYRTERGTYLFPRAYLPDRPYGYWIAGARMGLEENRRPAGAIEVESTFWMMRSGGAGSEATFRL